MRIIAGLLAILLAVGCSNKDKVPSDIIPRDKMEKILWDMVQADQYAAIYLIKDSAKVNVKTETLKLYEEVFRLHQVSRDEFRRSFAYYQQHPELTRNVFDSILAQGNRQRTENYSRPSLTTPKPPVTTPATGRTPPADTGPRPTGLIPKAPAAASGAFKRDTIKRRVQPGGPLRPAFRPGVDTARGKRPV